MALRDWLRRPFHALIDPIVPPAEDERETIRCAVRRIELRARRLMQADLAGQFRTAFRGRGLEFSEIREYLPGDEVRMIDWNVTARFGTPFIKQYVEERERNVLLLVDVSGSTGFGTTGRSVRSVAVELAGVLGFAASFSNDRVAAIAFSDRIEYTLPPRKGSRHVLRLLHDLLALRPAGTGTGLTSALEHAARVSRQRSVIFLISDLVAAGSDPWLAALRRLALRHEVVVIALHDPNDGAVPDAAFVDVADSETGVQVRVGRAEAVRLRDEAVRRRAEIARLLRAAGTDSVRISADQDYLPPLAALFRSRQQRQ